MKRPVEAGVVGDGEELNSFRGVVGWRCSSVEVVWKCIMFYS